jgi:hypothetical protein
MFSDFLTETLTGSTHCGGCGMSVRPGFYSGRGATTADLSSDKLERLFCAIKKHAGEPAAEAFVNMVAAMPSLSATDFLLSLARLESNGWTWHKRLLGAEKGLYAEDEGSAWGTVFARLGGAGERDDTATIRGAFLRAHGEELPAHERSPYEHSMRYHRDLTKGYPNGRH